MELSYNKSSFYIAKKRVDSRASIFQYLATYSKLYLLLKVWFQTNVVYCS